MNMASDYNSCLKTITLNVRGLRNPKKRRTIFHNLKQKNHDVIALQECHILSDFEADQWGKQIGTHTLYYTTGTNRSNGNIVLIKKEYREKTNVIIRNDRILLLEFETKDKLFLVLNIYAPQGTREKIRFFQEIKETIENNLTQQHALILLGDFNVAINKDLDIITGESHHQSEIDSFKDLVNSLELTDSWRALHLEDKEYTWSRNIPFIARRIDYIFLSGSLVENLQESKITTMPFTDHRAVETCLSFHNFTKGPSYWKFNNSLLRDKSYLDETNNLIEEIKVETQGLDPHSRLEMCKIKIKENTINYSKKKSKRTKNQIRELESNLNDLEKKLSLNFDETLLKQKSHLKSELEIIATEKANGAHIRARAKYIEKGEKQTNYFLSLEKIRANNNTITCLKNEQGEMIREQSEIMKIQSNFYKELYKEDTNTNNRPETYIQDFLGDTEMPKISENMKYECDLPITEEEVSLAIKQLNNGSAPGSDGLTSEFYKVFWSRLKSIILESFQQSFHLGHVSKSQQNGILSLIHKGKDSPRENLTNWRPITLLNTDYKILAKTIAIRLNKCINGLVSHDQCGFIKGRNIATLLRSTDDILEYVNKNKQSGILVGVDFQKAFDILSKNLIRDSLKLYGFGDNFSQWINVIISKSYSSINHFGWISEPFEVQRGIRQGCPLSPMLFVLAAEILATKLRNSEIKGIELKSNFKTERKDSTAKVSQFADDTSLFLKDKNDLEVALRIFDQFELISGLKLNKNKTQAMWLGKEKENNSNPFGLKWVKQIKILGIYFSNDSTASKIEGNWTERLEITKKTIKQWFGRNLSIYGKIIITKTFLMSPYIYLMQSIGLPEHVLTELNRLFFGFIWKKKFSNKRAFEKVKRKVMTQEFERGGLKMIDMHTLQQSLYLAWIPKLLEENNNIGWKTIPLNFYDKLGSGFCIFDNPCNMKSILGLTNDCFWSKVLAAWQKLKETREKNYKYVYLNSGIWNNNNIKYRNTNLHMSDWIRKGITNLKDILDDRGSMISFNEIEDKIGRKANRLLEYNAVRTAIEQLRQNNRLILREEETVLTENVVFENKSLCKLTVKDFRELINGKATIPCAVGFWKRKLKQDITEMHWQLAAHSNRETRLKVLQWKILHNIYLTKILLFKIGKADTNRCDACNTGESDYIEHFFYTCRTINQIWGLVTNEIMTRFGIQIKITIEMALLGYTDTTEHSYDINHLLSIAKMCISKFRYGERTPIDIIFYRELGLRQKYFQKSI